MRPLRGRENWNLTPISSFVAFKRWLAAQRDRDPLKRQRDGLQADAVQKLVDEYLPLPNPG